MPEEHQIYQDWLDQNTQQWDDWITQYTGPLDIDLSNIDIGPYYSGIAANDIRLTGGGEEMLRVAKDGFYVNGVKVKQGKREAEAVYKAFKQWMTWAILNGEINN